MVTFSGSLSGGGIELMTRAPSPVSMMARAASPVSLIAHLTVSVSPDEGHTVYEFSGNTQLFRRTLSYQDVSGSSWGEFAIKTPLLAENPFFQNEEEKERTPTCWTRLGNCVQRMGQAFNRFMEAMGPTAEAAAAAR